MRIGHVVVLHVRLQVVVRSEAGEVALFVLERAANRVLVGEKRDYELARFEDAQHAFDQVLVVVLGRVRLEAYVRAMLFGSNMNREIVSL